MSHMAFLAPQSQCFHFMEKKKTAWMFFKIFFVFHRKIKLYDFDTGELFL